MVTLTPWYHYDIFCGFQYAGHIDIRLDNKQAEKLRDELFKVGLDLVFNEKFTPWTIEQLKKYSPEDFETTIQEI